MRVEPALLAVLAAWAALGRAVHPSLQRRRTPSVACAERRVAPQLHVHGGRWSFAPSVGFVPGEVATLSERIRSSFFIALVP